MLVETNFKDISIDDIEKGYVIVADRDNTNYYLIIFEDYDNYYYIADAINNEIIKIFYDFKALKKYLKEFYTIKKIIKPDNAILKIKE